MEYRRLGKSGLIVSALSLGTMQFGKAMHMGGLNQDAASRMVAQALDLGVNLFDTANVYSRGEAEQLLGTALKGIRREVVLTTKARLPMSDDNFNRSGATRVNIMRSLEGSLKRLGTDYIDLYQLHGWDSNTPLEETLTTLDDIVRRGMVRYIGFSNFMAWQAATAIGLQKRMGLEPFVTAQMYYSLIGRDLEHEFIDFALYEGIGILVWSALAGGYLTGKYISPDAPPEGTRFAEAGQFIPFDWRKTQPVLKALRTVAKRHGVTMARVAYAWTVRRPAVISTIVAARTIAHLKDNLEAIHLRLTQSDLRILDHASNPDITYPKWMVLQLDQAEDPRSKVLDPERYTKEPLWEDLRLRQKP